MEAPGRSHAPGPPQVVVWALIGTAVCAALILSAGSRSGFGLKTFVTPGVDGPAVAVMHRDFPGQTLPLGIGHDGQQFYAIARQPMHWHAAAASLDRPRYRLERPLYPWLAWLLHPGGGGPGLVVALLAVGAAALALGGTALGTFAVQAGRSARWAVLFPLLPGAMIALRISTADTLAAALLLAALAALERRRGGPALALAVAAVLAKEITLLALVGYALAARRREAWVAVAGAGAALGAWYGAVLASVPTTGPQVVELTWPFVGLAHSLRWWQTGQDRDAALLTVATALIVVSAAGLRGGWRTPLGAATLAAASALVVLHWNAVELTFNSARTLLPVDAVALAAVLSRPVGRTQAGAGPDAAPSVAAPTAAEPDSGRLVGADPSPT